MSCKYCRKTVPSEEILVCEEGEVIVIETRSNDYVLNIYTEHENIGITINYCPMCGRKLKEKG